MQQEIPFENFTKWVILIPTFATLYFTSAAIANVIMGDAFSLIGLGNTIVIAAVFGSFTWTLSQALFRYLKIRHKNDVMAWTVAGLSAFLLMLEASMTHLGLVWASELMDESPPSYFLWLASIGLSIYNVLSKWGFLGAVEEKIEELIVTREDHSTEELLEVANLRVAANTLS